MSTVVLKVHLKIGQMFVRLVECATEPIPMWDAQISPANTGYQQ